MVFKAAPAPKAPAKKMVAGNKGKFPFFAPKKGAQTKTPIAPPPPPAMQGNLAGNE